MLWKGKLVLCHLWQVKILIYSEHVKVGGIGGWSCNMWSTCTSMVICGTCKNFKQFTLSYLQDWMVLICILKYTYNVNHISFCFLCYMYLITLCFVFFQLKQKGMLVFYITSLVIMIQNGYWRKALTNHILFYLILYSLNCKF